MRVFDEKELHKQLLETLKYEPETGKWFWLVTTSSRSPKGKETGNVSTNWQKATTPKRRYVRFNGKLYLAARLAFFYMTGRWPTPTVDHINRDSLDDRWENLREATYEENNRNRRFFNASV